MAQYQHIESALIHGGIYGDKTTGAVNVPIYQTSTYEQQGLGQNTGWEYSRTGNPTRAALEALIAELEGGTAGFAFASGLAAITTVLSLFRSGDKILISSNVYGGTFRLLDQVFQQFGIGYAIADTTNLTAFEAAITPEVRAVLVESPANPLLTVTDLAAVSEIAHRYGLLSIVDNTFMTPYLQRPLELGADIVVHSATKYLGGHSDLIAGLAAVRDSALAARLAFLQNAAGAVLGPFDSFLLIRGIKTLGVRMDRHVENAEKAAAFLRNHSAVKKVYYPGRRHDFFRAGRKARDPEVFLFPEADCSGGESRRRRKPGVSSGYHDPRLHSQKDPGGGGNHGRFDPSLHRDRECRRSACGSGAGHNGK